MACPAFGSTSEVKLYFAIDADPTAAVSSSQEWDGIRMTGESLDANLTSSISNEITQNRSFANSILTQGQSVGGFNFEATYVIADFLISALQADKELSIDGTPSNPWATTETIQNESTKQCLMFLKTVVVGATTYYYVYRGCQVDSLSLNMEPGQIVTGQVTIQGLSVEVGTSAASWTFVAADSTSPLMSSVDSVKNFVLTDSSDVTISATFQSLSITFSNQMRQQNAIGTGSIYAAGVGSGRFMAELSATLYFANSSMYDALIADDYVKLAFDLEDSAGTTNGNTFSFDMDFLKVQSGVTPLANGPDQDLMISPTLRAFEDATKGTVSITRTDAA